MKTRLQGIGLLSLCAIALHQLYGLVHGMPVHQPTFYELGLGLVVVLAGFPGAAMLVVGPSLLRDYVWPIEPRASTRPMPTRLSEHPGPVDDSQAAASDAASGRGPVQTTRDRVGLRYAARNQPDIELGSIPFARSGTDSRRLRP